MAQQRRSYEIVYDKFHKRWVLKPKGLPGALQVGQTRESVVQAAMRVCGTQSCILRIHNEDGECEEERSFGKDSG